MRSGFLAAVLCVATLAGGAGAAAGAEPTPDLVIPLDLSGPRPSVPISVAGGPAYPAVFDTGAMTTIINVDFAGRLAVVKEGPLGPPWNQHGVDGYQATVRNASIAGVPLETFSAPVMPLPTPDQAAVFSPSLFAGRLVILDFKAATLTVAAKTPERTPQGIATPYTAPPFALPAVTVTVGGQSYPANLDSGSPLGLTFPQSYAGRLPLAGPLAAVGSAAIHSGGPRTLYRARIKGEVRIGDVVLEDPEVTFTDAVPHVNVGGALLKRMKLVIDPEEKRSWTRPN